MRSPAQFTEELRGATITLSNFGMTAAVRQSRGCTAQVAIVGAGRIAPWWWHIRATGGATRAALSLTLTIGCDGREAARFMVALSRILSDFLEPRVRVESKLEAKRGERSAAAATDLERKNYSIPSWNGCRYPVLRPHDLEWALANIRARMRL